MKPRTKCTHFNCLLVAFMEEARIDWICAETSARVGGEIPLKRIVEKPCCCEFTLRVTRHLDHCRKRIDPCCGVFAQTCSNTSRTAAHRLVARQKRLSECTTCWRHFFEKASKTKGVVIKISAENTSIERRVAMHSWHATRFVESSSSALDILRSKQRHGGSRRDTERSREVKYTIE